LISAIVRVRDYRRGPIRSRWLTTTPLNPWPRAVHTHE
jgi:hypothetical protein